MNTQNRNVLLGRLSLRPLVSQGSHGVSVFTHIWNKVTKSLEVAHIVIQ